MKYSFNSMNAKVNYIKKVSNKLSLNKKELIDISNKIKKASPKKLSVVEIRNILKINVDQKRRTTYNNIVEKISAKYKIDADIVNVSLRDKNKIIKGKKITIENIKMAKRVLKNSSALNNRLGGSLRSWIGDKKGRKFYNSSLRQKASQIFKNYKKYIDKIHIDQLYFIVKDELINYNKTRKQLRTRNIKISKTLNRFFEKKDIQRYKLRTAEDDED